MAEQPRLVVRCVHTDLERWKAKAETAGLSLSAWVVSRLDADMTTEPVIRPRGGMTAAKIASIQPSVIESIEPPKASKSAAKTPRRKETSGPITISVTKDSLSYSDKPIANPEGTMSFLAPMVLNDSLPRTEWTKPRHSPRCTCLMCKPLKDGK